MQNTSSKIIHTPRCNIYQEMTWHLECLQKLEIVTLCKIAQNVIFIGTPTRTREASCKTNNSTHVIQPQVLQKKKILLKPQRSVFKW